MCTDLLLYKGGGRFFCIRMAHQFYDNTQEKFHDQLQERLLDCARVWAIWNLSYCRLYIRMAFLLMNRDKELEYHN
jgi:hypothetical protein